MGTVDLAKKTYFFLGNDSIGEVYIEIDVFTHAMSGEHKVTVKGKKLTTGKSHTNIYKL